MILGYALLPFLFPQAPFNPSPVCRDHWRPDRPDQYVCEYLGQNNCWRPSIIQEGPPYDGFESARPPRHKTCTVEASGVPRRDDAPAIRQAFNECSRDAHIVFENTTYYVHTVLNTTGLRDVDIEVRGTLAWDNSDIEYWLKNSIYVSQSRDRK